MTDAAHSEAAVSIVTPAKWRAESFWVGKHSRRVFGIVVAFCPTSFGLAVEAIVGTSRGFGLMVGPFWVGFATLTNKAPS